MWEAVGEETKRVYHSSKNKSDVMRWLNKKYPSERSSSSKFRKTVPMNRILPEAMTIKKS